MISLTTERARQVNRGMYYPKLQTENQSMENRTLLKRLTKFILEAVLVQVRAEIIYQCLMI